MWKNPKTQKGQTLIEAVVTLAVALVIISSVVTLVNSSNRRSNISRQATQASKLAQQGMEIVRNIRDVNDSEDTRVGRKAGPTPCDSASPCSWSELYEISQFDPTEACLLFDVASRQWRLVPFNGSSCETTPIMGVFTRQILINDNPVDWDGDGSVDAICADPTFSYADTKRVTIRVTWQSPTGESTRTVRSCITSWR